MVTTDDDRLFESLRAAVQQAPDGHPLPRPGDVVDGYRLLREVHRGGQGILFEARRGDPPARFALKVLLRRSAIGWDQRRQQREQTVSERLSHPCLVTPVAYGRHAGHDYCVMEWVEGTPLDHYCDAQGPDEIVAVFLRLCEGVRHAHERGVVHRDLKPANVLVEPDGTPRVLDFGIAKPLGESPTDIAQITATGEFLGTLGYAAPELLSHDSTRAGVGADIYSLGAMLYEALTGRLPFEVDGKLAPTIDRILRGAPRDPSRGPNPVDRGLRAILLRALAKRPAHRHSSVAALVDDLIAWRERRPIAAARGLTRMRAVEWLTADARRWLTPAILGSLLLGAWGISRSTPDVAPAAAQRYIEQVLEFHATDRPNADVKLLRLIDELGAATQSAQPMARARLHRQLGERYMDIALVLDAVQHFEQAREILEGSDPPATADLASCITQLADALLAAGDPRVLTTLSDAERRWREQDQPVQLARVLVLRARALRLGNDDGSADPEPLLVEASRRTEVPRNGSRAVRGVCEHERALLDWRREADDAQISRRFMDALDLLRDADARDRVECELDFAHFLETRGRTPDAAEHRRSAIDQLHTASAEGIYPFLLENAARRRLSREDSGGAMSLARARLIAALRTLSVSDPALELRAHRVASEIDGGDDVMDGLRTLRDAWGEGAYEISRVLAILADAYRLRGDTSQVRRLVEWEREQIHCRSFGDDCPFRVQATEALARCCATDGDAEEAFGLFERSFAVRRRQGWMDHPSGWVRLADYAETALTSGHTQSAAKLLDELERLFDGTEPADLSRRVRDLHEQLGQP